MRALDAGARARDRRGRARRACWPSTPTRTRGRAERAHGARRSDAVHVRAAARAGAPASATRSSVLGLSITSSWGNGHATTYRGLVRELARARPRRAVPRARRALVRRQPRPARPAVRAAPSSTASSTSCATAARRAVATPTSSIVGSYVPEGVAVGEWVTATAARRRPRSTTSTRRSRSRKLDARRPRVPRAALDPALRPVPVVHRRPDARAARARARLAARAAPLYCSVDPELYCPEPRRAALGPRLHGTYSDDRQPALERLLLEPARRWPAARFVVAGPQYPATIAVARATSSASSTSPPAEHRALLHRAALHAERHARRHDRAPAGRRACACSRPRRAARRSSATAGTGSRRCFEPRQRDPARGRARPTCWRRPARAAARRAPARSASGARRRVLARAHRRAPRRGAGGACAELLSARGRVTLAVGRPRDVAATPTLSTREIARARRRGSTTCTCPTARRPRPTTRSATSRASSGSRSRRTCRRTSPAGACSTSAATPASTASSWRGAARAVLGIDVDAALPARRRAGRRGQFGLERPRRVPRSMQVYDLARVDERVRPRAVHGRASTTCATRCSRSTCWRRRDAPPDGVPDADDARRRRCYADTPDHPHRRARRRCSSPAGRRWRSSSTGSPATRPTGGRPTTPASRRCCARAG